MPTYQSFNPKIKAWVKYEFTKDGVKFKNVKQKEPEKPFKNVIKKGRKK